MLTLFFVHRLEFCSVANGGVLADVTAGCDGLRRSGSAASKSRNCHTYACGRGGGRADCGGHCSCDGCWRWSWCSGHNCCSNEFAVSQCLSN